MLGAKLDSVDMAWEKAREILRDIRGRYAETPMDKYPRGGFFPGSLRLIKDEEKGFERDIESVILVVEFQRKQLTPEVIAELEKQEFFDEYKQAADLFDYPHVRYSIPYRVAEKKLE
jgi:hypothetical protein